MADISSHNCMNYINRALHYCTQ